MNKKSLDYKLAEKIIQESRGCGKTDQEIYNELSQQYFDKKSIALLISGTATAEQKKKYKMLNILLLVLIGIYVVLVVLYLFNKREFPSDLWFIIPFSVALLGMAGYFIYEIAWYNVHFYRMCVMFTIVFSFQGGYLRRVWNLESVIETIVKLLFVIAIVFLSIYLNKKLFSNSKHRKLKRDADGEYIFE
ncbi:MAG: hypothetical protein LBI45_09250 [Bacteroidales bacterium]|jgi:cation transport ATPase|nr:hypothetical protein [Bacteroidales bacterium]